MSCGGMRNLILDTNTKEIQIQVVGTPAADLHVTSNRYDHYKDITDFGNRHGFSDGANAATIVPAPDINQCWKREVTSISVYNPNDVPEMFYIIEYDNDTGTTTVIDEKLLNPFESWTLECICNCCNGCGVNVYDEGTLVYSNAYNLNFMGDCLSAVRNNMTGMVDIELALDLAFDPLTNILSLCGNTVDLSSMIGGSLSVYDNNTPIGITTQMNFRGCLSAAVDGLTGYMNIDWAPTISYDAPFRELNICGNTITLGEINPIGYGNASALNISWNDLTVRQWVTGLASMDSGTPGVPYPVRLPVIPSGTSDTIRGFRFLFTNDSATSDAIIEGATNVTVSGISHLVAQGQTVEYVVRSIGNFGTEYVRLG